MEPTDTTPDPPETPRPAWRRWLRRGLLGLGGAAGLLLLVVGGALLVLQTSWGSRAGARLVADLANPFEDAVIQIGAADGNWIQTLELRDVALVRIDPASGDSAAVARLDTLRARYALPALLRRTVHLRAVDLAGLTADVQQQADSSWTLPTLLPDTSEAPSAFTVRIDRLDVRDVRGSAQFYAPGRDSTLRVTDARLSARAIAVGPDALAARLNTLRLDARTPGTDLPLALRTRAALSGPQFTLDRLTLDAPNSRVTGQGQLRLPQNGTPLNDVQLTLAAAPLSFRDIAPFAPTLGLNPDGQLTLNADVTGSGQQLQLTADAALAPGGSLQLSATATPATDTAGTTLDSLRYQIDGQMRDLRPDRLFADTAAAAPTVLNGAFFADLAGPQLDRLSGAVQSRLFDTQLGGYALPQAQLDADVTDGEAQLDLEGTLQGARLRLTGTTRPLDAVPTYDLTARLAQLDLGAFLQDPAQQSDLAGTLRLRGRGLDTQTVRLTANLAVDPSRINRQPLSGGQARLTLAADTARFNATLAFPDGRLAATGRALLGTPTRITLQEGQLERVDIAALSGDTTASALSGTFRGQLTGLAPAQMTADATLDLRDSYYGPYALQTATGQLRLRDGTLRTDLDAALEGGQVAAAATARPFDDPLTAEVTEGSLQDLDIGAFLADTTQSSALNGTFTADGRGLDPATMQWTTQLSLSASQLNDQPLTSAQLDARLQRGTLDADLRWQTPEGGGAQLTATAQPFAETPTYAVTDGTLSAVNLGALAGLAQATTDLNGRLTLDGRGLDPAQMTLTSRLELERSRINRAALQQGRFTARVDSGTVTLDAGATFDQGTSTLQATARDLGTKPSFALSGELTEANLAALAGIDSVESSISSTFRFTGAGGALDTLTLDGRLTAQASRYGPVELETADVQFRLDRGLLRIDTLMARSNVAEARGGGQIALLDPDAQNASDLFVEAEAASLGPLRSVLGLQALRADSIRISGRAFGSPGDLAFDLNASVGNLLYDDLRMGRFRGQITGARGDTTLFSRVNATGDVGFLSVPALVVENIQYDAQYAGDTIGVATQVRLDRTRNAQLAGTVHLQDDPRLDLDRFDLRLGDDRWALLQAATVAYDDAYRISNFLLFSDNQQLAADGVVDFDGRQSLIVTMEGFRMNSIADLFGLTGLGGEVSGTLDLTGDAQAPELSSTLSLDVSSFDEDVGQLRLQANYSDLTLQTDAQLTHEDGSTMALRGTIPADLRLAAPPNDTAAVMSRPVDLALTADAFSIDWIDPFLDPELIANARGQFSSDIQIGGTLDDPALGGQATVRNGAFTLPPFEVTYDRISADLALNDNVVEVRQSTLRSGGRLQAQGSIRFEALTEGTFDLAIEGDDFLAIDTRDYRARLDGDLALGGALLRPELTGDLTVQSGDFYLTTEDSESELATVRLTAEDQRVLEQRFGIRLSAADTTTFDFYEALSMDLAVRISNDTWFRSRANPELAVQFTGDLDVTKASFEEEQAFGSIQVVPERSRLVQFGRVFNITRGTLTFNGPVTEPVMDLEALYEPRTRDGSANQVQITLALNGRPEELDLTLSSNPTMSTSDIFCYIALGTPCGQFGGGQDSFAGGDLATDVAFGQATNIIENLAASALGLDVIRIENRGTGTYLTAGQYLSPRFYAAIEQAITNPGNQQQDVNVPNVTLEYELTRWLMIRALYQNPDFRFNFLWEYAY